MPVSHNIPPPGPGSYMHMGYPPGFYGQYPHPVLKPGECPPPVYPVPQYFLASVPPIQPQLQGPTDGENNQYTGQGYYQAAVLATMPYHPTYAIPRADGGPLPPHYPAYSPMYPKPAPLGDEQGEEVNGGGLGNEDQEGVDGKAE